MEKRMMLATVEPGSPAMRVLTQNPQVLICTVVERRGKSVIFTAKINHPSTFYLFAEEREEPELLLLSAWKPLLEGKRMSGMTLLTKFLVNREAVTLVRESSPKIEISRETIKQDLISLT